MARSSTSLCNRSCSFCLAFLILLSSVFSANLAARTSFFCSNICIESDKGVGAVVFVEEGAGESKSERTCFPVPEPRLGVDGEDEEDDDDDDVSEPDSEVDDGTERDLCLVLLVLLEARSRDRSFLLPVDRRSHDEWRLLLVCRSLCFDGVRERL